MSAAATPSAAAPAQKNTAAIPAMSSDGLFTFICPPPNASTRLTAPSVEHTEPHCPSLVELGSQADSFDADDIVDASAPAYCPNSDEFRDHTAPSVHLGTSGGDRALVLIGRGSKLRVSGD